MLGGATRFSGMGLRTLYMARTIATIRDIKPHTLVVTSGHNDSIWGPISFLSGAISRAGEYKGMGGRFYNIGFRFSPEVNRAQVNFALVKSILGTKASNEPIDDYLLIKPPPSAMVNISVPADSTTLIAVSPGVGAIKAKMWPARKFVELINALMRLNDVRVILLGGPDEVLLADKIHSACADSQKVLNLTGRLSPGQLLYVLSKTQMLIGNDSGLAHLSAALGKETVVLFGPTSAKRTGPMGRTVHIVDIDLQCRPCYVDRYPFRDPVKACGNPVCMKNISTAAVLDVVYSILLGLGR